jgi:2Fe-2S ferredoxin
MPTIIYVQPDGKKVSVEADVGANVMRTAIANNVAGIVAECGGSAMCATCHVYVDEEYATQLPPVGEVENEMLESAAAGRLAASRLSCQLILPEGLDTLVVRVAEKQTW